MNSENFSLQNVIKRFIPASNAGVAEEPPDIEQKFDAFASLRKDEADVWNANICGELSLDVKSADERLAEFVTFTYTPDGTEEERFLIKIAPTHLS